MQLPLQSTLQLLQTRWKSILDPVIANPMTNMSILENIVLASGNNQVAHKLQRMQQGWVIVDINGAGTIFRYKPFTDSYLYLTASTALTVSIGVF
jgi:hypothetical protein